MIWGFIYICAKICSTLAEYMVRSLPQILLKNVKLDVIKAESYQLMPINAKNTCALKNTGRLTR
jgi:hypothetical protein